MTRSVLSLAILLAALTGSLLLTPAVRSETGNDTQATESQDNGCCPAMCDPLYQEEYNYYYEGYDYEAPQDNPIHNKAEETIASEPAEGETESANEMDEEEYTSEDVDYWYDSETGEYHDYEFAAEEMTPEETVEANTPEEPAQDETSILVEDASIAAADEEPAYDKDEHSYDDMYDYEDEYAYEYNDFAESSAEEEVEATTEAVAAEESEQEYDDYWDDGYEDGGEDSYFEEESVEIVEDTPEPSNDENVDDLDDGYDYWEQYQLDYPEGMEQLADDSERAVEEAVDEVTEEADDFDYGYEYWDEYEYGEDVEQIADDNEQVAEESTDEEVAEESDDFDYGDEYWNEYDYYYEDALEAEIVENSEDGELGADAELECWIEADLAKMKKVASRQPKQSVNDREAILSLARTLDRVGTALQALSRELTEMADAEVAELPTSDEAIQR